ncbi:GtrA family protein [Bacillus methanolicus]|nr:GtrA family protein [Bacillus methanolicus]EIJ77705.1 GtrA-like protein [Bacillus methanolicus MGA3]UQD50884.1 GtrA family protein [Bacillus methanolicus]
MIFETYLKRTSSFIRFLAVGVVNTMIGLTIMFLLMHAVGMSYWLSTFFGNMTGAIASYFLNRSFTFDSHVPIAKGGFRFAAVICSCYFFSYTISRMLSVGISSDFPLQEKDFAVIGGTAIYTVTNYLGQKYFVFKK